MTRFFSTLALAAALTAPVSALADMPRATSPARHALQQMIDLPLHRRGPRQTVAGDWTPTEVRAQRFGLIDLPGRYSSWFSIRRDGELSFSLGCNRYWGDARMRHGAFSIGPLAGTRMACAPRVTQAERRVLRALRGAARVEAGHGGVRFMDRRGNTVLVLSDPAPRLRRIPRYGH